MIRVQDKSKHMRMLLKAKNVARKYQYPQGQQIFDDLITNLQLLCQLEATDRHKLLRLREIQDGLAQNLDQMRGQLAVCVGSAGKSLKKYTLELTKKLSATEFWDNYAKKKYITADDSDALGHRWVDMRKQFQQKVESNRVVLEKTPVRKSAEETVAKSFCSRIFGSSSRETIAANVYKCEEKDMAIHRAIVHMKQSIDRGHEQNKYVKRRGLFAWIFSCISTCARKLPQGLQYIYQMISKYLSKVQGHDGKGTYQSEKHHDAVCELWKEIGNVASSKVSKTNNSVHKFLSGFFIGRNRDVYNCYSRIAVQSRLFLRPFRCS